VQTKTEKYHLQFYPNASEFLAVARPVLMATEDTSNLMLGLAEAMVSKASQIRSWIVSTPSGPQFLIFQTPPHNLILSPASDLAPVAFAAKQIAAEFAGLDFLGVVGPVHEVDVFAQAWKQATGQNFQLGYRTRMYRADSAQMPEHSGQSEIPGRMICANSDHLNLVTQWTYQFALEAHPHEAGTIEKMREATTIRLGRSQIFLWEVERQAVAQVLVSGETPAGTRLSAVYTPPELRGKGFATALVAQITQQKISEGKKFCVLFTDLGNATSNSIYQKIGYRAIADSANFVRLSEAAQNLR